MRTVPELLRADPPAGEDWMRGGLAVTAGNSTRKVVPRPGVLSTVRRPRWLRMMPCTAARPRPRPVNLVVKNGSKILATVAGSIPEPAVSYTHLTLPTSDLV